MLLSFEVENFGSFRDRAHLDLLLAANAEAPHRIAAFDAKVAAVAMIYGANASGKTTLLDALMSLRTAVVHSHRSWDPTGGTNTKPFALRQEPHRTPTRWRVRFSTGTDPHSEEYDYEVLMNTQVVLHETLRVRSVTTRRFRRIFTRQELDVASSSTATRALASRLRPNALMLSLAAQENQAEALATYTWFKDRIVGAKDLSSPTMHDYLLRDLVAHDMPDLSTLARMADLGILEVRGRPWSEAHRHELHEMGRRLADALGDLVPGIGSDPMIRGDFESLDFVHSGSNGASFTLPRDSESSGTIAFLAAGRVAQQALATGDVVLFDELDGSLHPTLVEQLVELFRSPETNPLGAQLIASTHDTHLFGRSALLPLSKYEVWFTEKDSQGASELYSLADFGDVRRGVNQEHRYLAGAFGAQPSPRLSLAMDVRERTG